MSLHKAPGGKRGEPGVTPRLRVLAASAALAMAAVAPSGTLASGFVPEVTPGDEILLAGAVPDSELAEYRGGLAIGALNIEFGVAVRTTVQNAFEMLSLLNITDRVGDKAGGTITSTVTNLTTGVVESSQVSALGSGLSPVVLTVLQGTSGPGASVTTDFSKGVLSIFRNQIDNVAVSQSVSMNVKIENFQAAVLRARMDRMASHLHGYTNSKVR